MMANWDLATLFERLPELDLMVHLLVGDLDRAVPPQDAHAAERRLPNAQIVALNGLGHLAHEEDPARVAEAIEGVLAAAPASQD